MIAMLQQKPKQLVLGLHHSTTCKAEELTATIQPGLHHTAMKWLFLASESLHTHTHTHINYNTQQLAVRRVLASEVRGYRESRILAGPRG